MPRRGKLTTPAKAFTNRKECEFDASKCAHLGGAPLGGGPRGGGPLGGGPRAVKGKRMEGEQLELRAGEKTVGTGGTKGENARRGSVQVLGARGHQERGPRPLFERQRTKLDEKYE